MVVGGKCCDKPGRARVLENGPWPNLMECMKWFCSDAKRVDLERNFAGIVYADDLNSFRIIWGCFANDVLDVLEELPDRTALLGLR